MLTERQRANISTETEAAFIEMENAMLAAIVDSMASLDTFDPAEVNRELLKLRPKLNQIAATHQKIVLEAARRDLEASFLLNEISELEALENATRGE